MEGKPLPVNASLPWMKWAWVRARVHVTALSPDALCGGCAENFPNSPLMWMVPGNLILRVGGWHGIPHGELDTGAKCVSLRAIIATLMPACVLKLRTFVSQILRFQLGYTPTNLMDGELRPMTDAMGSALVMHYGISAKYFETEDTRVLMCNPLIAVCLADNPLQTHTSLCEWGELVKVALPQ